MPTLTHDQIRTLAPDASAARSGEALADRRRWDSAGRTDVVAWGLVGRWAAEQGIALERPKDS